MSTLSSSGRGKENINIFIQFPDQKTQIFKIKKTINIEELYKEIKYQLISEKNDSIKFKYFDFILSLNNKEIKLNKKEGKETIDNFGIKNECKLEIQFIEKNVSK